VLRADGLSTQNAFDLAKEMLRDCYRRWYFAQADLPQFGEGIDAEVQKYIIAIRNFMIASLNWQ
jgi:hypothetical protein